MNDNLHFIYTDMIYMTFPVIVETFPSNEEFLVGRRIIIKFKTIIDGNKEEICLESENA